MPVNLTEAEIKGRDDRPPAKRIALSIHIGQGYFKYIVCMKLKLNKIAARWPAKAVAQFFTFSKKGSDRIVPR